MAYLPLLEDLAAHDLRQKHIFIECHMLAESDDRLLKRLCAESPYMEMAWAYFMQTNNLWHAAAHLVCSNSLTLEQH